MKHLFLASLLLIGTFVRVEATTGAALPHFADLIEEVSPAVVKINTVASRSSAQQRSPSDIPQIYRDFFGFDLYGPNQPRQQPPTTAIGSGFIISSDGFILTNYHVIAGAEEIQVRLIDRREFRATLIGSDEQSDLALLRIEAENLPTVEFAEPDSLRVGEWVLAIGSPFDLDYSASVGIVSAIGRSLPTNTGQNYVPFIQTDVAINPGNSGGPLFNLDGEVVGINSQIYTRSGGFMGLSFAIPVGVARDVVRQLQSEGYVERGWLGVVIQDVSQDLATSFGLDRPQGALVAQVLDQSPAAHAGIQPGDIILKFNGRDIVYSHDLPHVVGLVAPGTTATAELMRDSRQQTMRVEVGALPTRVAAPSRGAQPNAVQPARYVLGMRIEPLDSRTSGELGIRGGVRIVDLEADGPAITAGLAAGDIIVRLGFDEVTSPESFNRIAADLPAGKLVPVRFWRSGSWFFRTIERS